MRIGIDARTILNPEKGDSIGIGHYTYQLIRHLLDIDRENEYVLFFDARVREKDVKKFTRPNTQIRFYPFSDYRKYLPGLYNELLGSAILAKEKLDVLHVTSPVSKIPRRYKGKTVVTVHDLAFYKVPEAFPKNYNTKMKALLNLAADKADKIITVSESTKKDLEELLESSAEKIQVIYSGFDKRFFEAPEISREKVFEKFGIPDGYILFLGTLEPIKNITRLFEAFKTFKETLAKNQNASKFPDYKLVMAGKSGWLAKEYKQMAEDLGIGNNVIFTGYVAPEELVPLFKNAEFFVMPSLYEGFGTTVLEAFATETPAILSRVSSIPELADMAAELVNPNYTKNISDAMVRFAKDQELKDLYRKRGKERAEKFDWEKCAEKTLEVYLHTYKQNK